MNEDGDWWVPVEGIPFKKARELVLSCLDAPIVPRLAYIGKEMQWLDSEHEGHYGDDSEDGPESEACPSNRYVLAYHFEERGND